MHIACGMKGLNVGFPVWEALVIVAKFSIFLVNPSNRERIEKTSERECYKDSRYFKRP